MIGLMIFSFSFGQTNPKYDSIINEAVPFIKNRDWLKAAQKYSEAFITIGNTGFLVDRQNPSMLQERYDLARLWAMSYQLYIPEHSDPPFRSKVTPHSGHSDPPLF